MASGDEVKVLGLWASPFVMRARIALNLKGVDYESVEETLSSKSELLLNSNPVYKRVPVLIHNGKPICESMVMVEYIDDVWSASGPSLLPSDPYDRAIARFWAVYIDNKFGPEIKGVVLGPWEEGTAEEAEELYRELHFMEEAFKKCSKGKGFFGGDTVGYLDIALGSLLGWLRVTGRKVGVELLDQGKTPLLAGWAERFCLDAVVKEVMPETEKLVEYARRL